MIFMIIIMLSFSYSMGSGLSIISLWTKCRRAEACPGLHLTRKLLCCHSSQQTCSYGTLRPWLDNSFWPATFFRMQNDPFLVHHITDGWLSLSVWVLRHGKTSPSMGIAWLKVQKMECLAQYWWHQCQHGNVQWLQWLPQHTKHISICCSTEHCRISKKMKFDKLVLREYMAHLATGMLA